MCAACGPTPTTGASADDPERARRHFATGADDDCTPFLSPRALVPVLDRLIAAWDTVEAQDDALDAFYRAVEHDEPEAIELAVTALIELHEGDDAEIDALLRVDESGPIDNELALPPLASCSTSDSHGSMNSRSTTPPPTNSGGS